MRRLLCLVNVLALVLLTLAAEGATAAKKKSTTKKGTKSVAAAGKKTGTSARKKTGTSTAASKRGKKGPAQRTTWRNRQLTPTPDRYKQIQEALSAKGYLPAEQANGQWNDASAAALKKFQADQNLEANGKINSLSLIALGLGPKRETATAAKPAPSSPGPP